MDLFVFKDCNPEVFWSCKTSKYFVLCLNRCFWWKICEGHPIHIWRKSIVYTDLIAILTAAVRDFGSEVEAIERSWTEGFWEVMSSSRFHNVVKIWRHKWDPSWRTPLHCSTWKGSLLFLKWLQDGLHTPFCPLRGSNAFYWVFFMFFWKS